MKQLLNSKFGMYAVGGVVVLAVLWYVKNKVVGVTSAALSQAATAFNPLDSNNVVYTGVNDAGAAISGDKNFSLGVWLYDVLHPSGAMLPDQPTNGSIKAKPAGGNAPDLSIGATGYW